MRSTTFHGVTVHRCACVPYGTHIYLRGGDLLAISEPHRRKFLALFGLHESAPKGADAIALNPAEADELLALVGKEAAAVAPFLRNPAEASTGAPANSSHHGGARGSHPGALRQGRANGEQE